MIRIIFLPVMNYGRNTKEGGIQNVNSHNNAKEQRKRWKRKIK